MFHLMDKENHEDSMLDKALMFPILASVWAAKKVKKQEYKLEDLIKALTIMLKHGDVAHPCYCEHDTLYIYPNSMDFTEEEFATLENLGFIRDEEGFYSFKYGSC